MISGRCQGGVKKVSEGVRKMRYGFMKGSDGVRDVARKLSDDDRKVREV